jgi:hypothetical protein
MTPPPGGARGRLGCSRSREGFVDIVAALIADAEAAVLVEPGDRTLDDQRLVPSRSRTRSSARRSSPGCRADAARGGPRASGRSRRRTARAAGGADGHGGHAPVGSRPAAGAAGEMSLRLPPVSETASGVGVLYGVARDQSIRSASCSFASSSTCSRCQTATSCHSRSLRQPVIPEPQPISCGRLPLRRSFATPQAAVHLAALDALAVGEHRAGAERAVAGADHSPSAAAAGDGQPLADAQEARTTLRPRRLPLLPADVAAGEAA